MDVTRTRVSVIAVNSLRGVLSEAIPGLEENLSANVDVRYLPTAPALEEIRSGARPSVVLVTDQGMSELIEDGFIRSGLETTLASSEVGFAIAASAQEPKEINLERDFTEFLRSLDSIAYASRGGSGLHFLEVVERLGLSDEVAAKAVTIEGGLVGELVTEGKAQCAIQMIPELMAVPGLNVVGPFPSGLGKRLTLQAGLFSGVDGRGPAAGLIDSLACDRASNTFRAHGFSV